VLCCSQLYYYNAETRESAWSKPSHATVITQSELEALAAAQTKQSETPSKEESITQPLTSELLRQCNLFLRVLSLSVWNENC
jgi:hypothetical protein